jgi:superkiller protein 3
LGLLLGQSGQSARSLEIYRQVLALRPNRSSAWVGLGNNLLYLGRLPEAAEAYRKAHAADAGNREACHNLAMVLRKLGRAEEAALYAACAATPP